jgi:hypothetical protein
MHRVSAAQLQKRVIWMRCWYSAAVKNSSVQHNLPAKAQSVVRI